MHVWNLWWNLATLQRHMHLELEWDLPCYKEKAVQVAPEMKHQTAAYSDPSYLGARPVKCGLKIQEHRKRSTRYPIWICKTPSLLLSEWCEYYHRLQTTSSNIQKRCKNTITEITMNSIQNMPGHSQNHIWPWPDLFIEDLLSRHNHKENKDTEIPSMQLNIDVIQTTTNIPDCMTIHKPQQAMSQDEHWQHLREHNYCTSIIYACNIID